MSWSRMNKTAPPSGTMRWIRACLLPLLLAMATAVPAQTGAARQPVQQPQEGREAQKAPAPASAAPFEVQTVRECLWLTRWVLGKGMCGHSYYVPLPGDAAVGQAKPPEVQLTGPAGSEVADTAVSAKKAKDGRLLLKVDPGSLSPGTYSGKVIYGDAEPRPSVPISVKVRAPALWPLILIIAGVLLGQLLKYMNERGNAIADARAKLDRLRARARRLDSRFQDAAAPAVAETDMFLDQRDVAASTAALAKLEKTVGQLETLSNLSRHPKAGEHEELIGQIIDMIGSGLADPDAKIEELRAALGGRVPSDSRKLQEGIAFQQVDPLAPTAGDGRRAALADLWGGFIAYAARPLIYAILLVLLVLVGLNALYVSGSATLGANPLTDGLALFAWGLAADVASRTLTNFRGDVT